MSIKKKEVLEKENSMDNTELIISQIEEIINSSHTQLSDIKPSDWVEQNVVMGKPFPGPFRYDKTPYTRKIVDCLAPDHPARVIAVMKGAQIGFSAGVIYAGICWMIKNNPGNTFLTVGSPELIEKAMEKLDQIIDSTGLRKYIFSQAQRKRATKTGDTNLGKEFAGGYIRIVSAGNHKAIRQVDLQYGFFDDFESVKSASKESGSTRKLLEQRFAAYADQMKMFLISTPEMMETSNIYEAYMLGDQQKWHIPCPCCGEMIVIEWSVESEINGEKIRAGFTWESDEHDRLIPGSVRYVCPKCGGKFDDRNKHELINAGDYFPTAEPSRPDFYTFHIPSFYAYSGMFDWEHYVQDWIEANPKGQPPNESKMKTFRNLVEGLPYESPQDSPVATSIMSNTRDYEIDTIPERLSIADGNGRIVLLTCAADMNGTIFNESKGTVDDARIDYEIVAWSESGASYSITHGSIGTFIPLEGTKKNKIDREKWTYAENRENSVWPELLKIITKVYTTDTGRNIGIGCTALDSGHYTSYAYNFIDKVGRTVRIRGIKGDKEDQYLRFSPDPTKFKPAIERKDLYILTVGLYKDMLSDQMNLNWNEGTAERQPAGFMNFPKPDAGKYSYPGYYQHYEAEQRTTILKKDGGSSSLWKKKKSTNQNHFFDCRVYNLAIKEIFVKEVGKSLKIPNFTWVDWAKVAVRLIEKGGN